MDAELKCKCGHFGEVIRWIDVSNRQYVKIKCAKCGRETIQYHDPRNYKLAIIEAKAHWKYIQKQKGM